MTPKFRLCITGLGVALLGIIALPLGLPAQASTSPLMATPAPISANGQVGLDQVAQCLASNPNLAVELLVDQSASLQDTDPQNKRAEILASVVDSLSTFSGQKLVGKNRRVDVAVSRFDIAFEPWIPWTTLSSKTANSISAKIRREIPGSNQGQGTNHPDALRGARNALNAGAARFGTEQAPCKLLIMFTDGVLNVSNNPAENQAAANEMCRVRGVVDGLRGDDVSIVTFLLFDRSTLSQFTADNQAELLSGIELLRATAEGSGQGRTCGRVPIPKTSRSGAYLEGNADALAGLFGTALARGAGGTQVPATGSPTNLRIDPGVRSFRIVALAPNGFTLSAPNAAGQIAGQQGSGGGAVAGGQAGVTWTGGTVTIDVPVTDQGLGSWTFARSGQNNDFGFFLFSGLQVQLDDGELVSGTPATLKGRIVDQAGTPAPLGVYGSKQLTVKALDANGNGTEVPFTLNDDGTFSGTFVPQSDSTSTTFDVTLSLVTAPSQAGTAGIELQPVVRQFTQPVRLPSTFPQVSPSDLSLSTLKGKDDVARATLTLTGSPDGATKVCLGETTLTDLDNPQQFAIDGDGQCVDLAVSETKTVEITARDTAEAIDAQVKGAIPLTITGASTPAAPGVSREVQLPLSFLSIRPVDQLKRGIEFFLLLIAGLLIPWLILFLANRYTARLSLRGIQAARIPVKIAGLEEDAIDGTVVAFIRPGSGSAAPAIEQLNGKVRMSAAISQGLSEARGTRDQGGSEVTVKRTDGQEPLFAIDDFAFIRAPENRVTQWSPGPERLVARTPGLNVFGSLRGEVRAPEGSCVAGGANPRTADKGRMCGIALDPAGEFYLLMPAVIAVTDGSGRGPTDPGPVPTAGPKVPPPTSPPSPFPTSPPSPF